MSNALTAHLCGQRKLKSAVADSTVRPNCCASVTKSPTTIPRTPPVGFWIAAILPILNLEGHLSSGKPLTKAPESLSTAVRVQQWTEVFGCHARRPSCGTSSGASEIAQEPFLIKLDDTVRLVLHNFAWERLTRHRRALAGVLQRLQCGVVPTCDGITFQRHASC